MSKHFSIGSNHKFLQIDRFWPSFNQIHHAFLLIQRGQLSKTKPTKNTQERKRSQNCNLGGPGMRLAHLPEILNVMPFHFPIQRQCIHRYDTTDLLRTAIHEIGHVLGLEHSKERDSVMSPFYHQPIDADGNYVMPKLTGFDILRIQELYGNLIFIFQLQ